MQAVLFCYGKHAVFNHLHEHLVAALFGTFWVAFRIVEGGVFCHGDEYRSLLYGEVNGLLVEVYAGGRIDTYGLVEKVQLVQIQGNDFVFRIEPFELYRNDPFAQFLSNALHQITRGFVVLHLRQLLRERRAPTFGSQIRNSTCQCLSIHSTV